MSISTFKITTKESGIVIVAEPIDNYKEVMLDVYISVGKEPTIEMHDFQFKLPNDLEIWEMDEQYDNWKIFMDPETVRNYSPKMYALQEDVSVDGGDVWYRVLRGFEVFGFEMVRWLVFLTVSLCWYYPEPAGL